MRLKHFLLLEIIFLALFQTTVKGNPFFVIDIISGLESAYSNFFLPMYQFYNEIEKNAITNEQLHWSLSTTLTNLESRLGKKMDFIHNSLYKKIDDTTLVGKYEKIQEELYKNFNDIQADYEFAVEYYSFNEVNYCNDFDLEYQKFFQNRAQMDPQHNVTMYMESAQCIWSKLRLIDHVVQRYFGLFANVYKVSTIFYQQFI